MTEGRHTDENQADEQREIDEAAWGVRSRAEPRWPATLAILGALVLYVFLPDKLTYIPRWILPALEGILLIPLQISAPRRHIGESRVRRTTAIILIGLIYLANVGSLWLLVTNVINGHATNGAGLISSAVLIWLTNVIVFGLWFWELDRGGPAKRAQRHHREPDLLFPQMVTPQAAEPDWSPSFLDYLFVAFTNATAFSPTDTMPLTEWAKGLFMVESLASFITVGIVAARAVNIIH